jgi:hypothetical protein
VGFELYIIFNTVVKHIFHRGIWNIECSKSLYNEGILVILKRYKTYH